MITKKDAENEQKFIVTKLEEYIPEIFPQEGAGKMEFLFFKQELYKNEKLDMYFEQEHSNRRIVTFYMEEQVFSMILNLNDDELSFVSEQGDVDEIINLVEDIAKTSKVAIA